MNIFKKIKESITKTTKEVSDKFKDGLSKTRTVFSDKIFNLILNYKKIDDEFYEELEEILISADIGVKTVLQLMESLKSDVKKQKITDTSELQPILIDKILNLLGDEEDTELNMAQDGLTIILFVGVNGVGKTTSIGKLANRLKNEGKKVLLAAGDTFRAAAIDQLDIWGSRIGVDVIKHQTGSDPAAVIFDAIQAAKSRNMDILIIDTAGRLHNKVNLMEELKKIHRVIEREVPNGPHEVLLALDATTGQNALYQAKTFAEATKVTGLVLTKLDGTAKGGIVLAIKNELKIPVKLVGLGEKLDDIQRFDPKQFIYALFPNIDDKADITDNN